MFDKSPDTEKIVSIFELVATVLLVVGFAFYQNLFGRFMSKGTLDVQSAQTDCTTKVDERTVRGISLSGLIRDGDEIKILDGYYNCGDIERGDIVAYSFSGNPDPIIKVAKGIPGDSFKLVSNGNERWNIIINGEVAKNSLGEDYSLDERGYRMLALYEDDYDGMIPLNTYLLLGNLPGGTLDSSHFGLVSKNGIIGKVVK